MDFGRWAIHPLTQLQSTWSPGHRTLMASDAFQVEGCLKLHPKFGEAFVLPQDLQSLLIDNLDAANGSHHRANSPNG